MHEWQGSCPTEREALKDAISSEEETMHDALDR
jgi:hypothetical protein